MTHRSTWKSFERVIADAWNRIFGTDKITIKRNPLSGANNRKDSGDPRPGDVCLPDTLGLSILIEAKYRSSFLHHRLFRTAQQDAAKHKITHTILYTKSKGETGYLAVLDADLFHKILAIEGARNVISNQT